MQEEKQVLIAHVPVALKFPEVMRRNLKKVLSGDYDVGYFGNGLTILDIGANVGSFTLWANMRWPSSTIHAYEPQPETFRLLEENVQGLSNVHCHNVAIYPADQATIPFFSRWAGDGEAGIASIMASTFASISPEHLVDVKTLQPGALPQADVIKLDVEGSEYHILSGMNVTLASLILLEFQFSRIRNAIKLLLANDFVLEQEISEPWEDILQYADYRKDLAGDCYGLLKFANRRTNRLTKLASTPER
jgi:FkbM family methyltransferase